MQTARILFYFGAIRGKLYVVAGYNGLLGGELSSVECYNIEQNSWEYKKSMDVRLHEHAGRYNLLTYCIPLYKRKCA